MKIHALTTVKDEDDVVAEALTAAARWCDYIYVLDNGSTDDTWGIVQDLARTVPQVVPYKVDPRPFSDGVRAEIFHHFRDNAGPEDWWARQDSDEFYVDDPWVFLRKIPERYPGGELGPVHTFAPSMQIIDRILYHTSLDTDEYVPASGLENAARAYAKIIDDVNKVDLAELRAPPPAK